LDFPGFDDWLKFREIALQLGFFEPYEAPARARGWKFKAPRKRERGEVQLRYVSPDPENDYMVVVRPTKLQSGGWVGQDHGWVLIVDRAGRIRYSSHPLIRTEHFLEKLLMLMRIARWRVFYRPKHCGYYMHLVHRNGAMKSCFWKCAVHPRTHRAGFEELRKSFPAEVRSWIEAERAKRERYRRKARSAGKDPFAAMKGRKSWKKVPIGEPQIIF